MRQIPATEAKSRLAELLRNVEYGETVAITRHGKPIAHLVPARDQERSTRKEAVQRFRNWHRNRQPIGLTSEQILDLIHEERRW